MCETEEKNQYQGACLCGGIQYAVSKIEDRMAHCHCSMCRKFHGAAFATFGEAKKENFQWLCGEELIRVYEGANGTKRLFCSVCGSSLVFVPSNDTGRFVEFSLGTLDTPIPQRPDAHIFTQYSAGWYEITDDLPQFLNGRDGEMNDKCLKNNG